MSKEDYLAFIIEVRDNKFLVALGTTSLVKLTVDPIEFNDNRVITVIETVDTETDDTSYSIKMPEIADEERPVWMDGVNVASLVMANLDELQESGVLA